MRRKNAMIHVHFPTTADDFAPMKIYLNFFDHFCPNCSVLDSSKIWQNLFVVILDVSNESDFVLVATTMH